MSRPKPPLILSRLRGVRPAGDGWTALCPVHADDRNSLSVGVGADGRVLLNCHAKKCPYDAIARACHLEPGDLMAPAGSATNGRKAPTIITTYDYRDEGGAILFQVCRLDPKDFRQRRPSPTGSGWTWGTTGVRRVVYRLDELTEQSRVWWVEGEKDADRLWSLGLPATTSPGGASAWRAEYAAQIRAVGAVEVIAVPDHDAPGAAYVLTMAAAVTAAGVAVRILELPGLPPKGDVSDWLDAGHTADDLVALAAQTAVYAPEPAADEALSPEAIGGDLQRAAFDLSLSWSDGALFLLTAIHASSRDGVRGELTVSLGARRLSWGSFTLSSTAARESLRKKLEAVAPGTPWGDYLEAVAYRMTQTWREGEPLVELTGTIVSPTRELMPRLLYEGEPTLLYGDGDTGKSLMALAVALAVHSGASLPHGLRPVRACPAAYLDWETSRDTIEARLTMLATGLGVEVPRIIYKRMNRPLVDEVTTLAAEFARRGVGLVVIDSKMFAVAGGEGAAFHEPITAFYRALRLFAPAATLVLNHVTNAEAKNGGPSRPFGGAFAFNGPRLIWEAKRDHEVADATAIAFACKKANNLSMRPEPFGLRFQPGVGSITVFPLDLATAAPSVLSGTSLPYRIRLSLARADRTYADLIEELGCDDVKLRVAMGRLEDRGLVARVGDSKPILWRLSEPEVTPRYVSIYE